MLLDNKDIHTEEVKHWRGLHLLYFPMSSCSQKIRILLKEKHIAFTPHVINLKKAEHMTPWFLGINARGVVPVLVDDGRVHIESNDILCHLDQAHASEQTSFLPKNEQEEIQAKTLLDLEDKMHVHLRVITMQYLVPSKLMRKSPQQLKAYSNGGDANDYRQKQVDWWQKFSSNGISQQQIHAAIHAFHQSFSILDDKLKSHKYLLGTDLSVVDISWFLTLHRLALAGYPMHLYPNLNRYYLNLLKRPHFRQTVSSGPFLLRLIAWVSRTSKRFFGPTLQKLYQAQFVH